MHTDFPDKSNFKKPGVLQPVHTWLNPNTSTRSNPGKIISNTFSTQKLNPTEVLENLIVFVHNTGDVQTLYICSYPASICS